MGIPYHTTPSSYRHSHTQPHHYHHHSLITTTLHHTSYHHTPPSPPPLTAITTTLIHAMFTAPPPSPPSSSLPTTLIPPPPTTLFITDLPRTIPPHILTTPSFRNMESREGRRSMSVAGRSLIEDRGQEGKLAKMRA
nr:SKI family transcriptional corepressor 2-like [Penaeus vannamei]